MVYNGIMKNKHLEHPEDSILTLGKEGAIDTIKFLKSKRNQISVKYDGAPAIVYGVNPENGRFFVGTKSVFNKKKVKINYSHSDIEFNHGHIPNVASILHTCLECLPTDHGVYQCDFIGYGGDNTFKPNTITYKFDKVIKQSVVVATHTQYIGTTIQDLDAVFHYRNNNYCNLDCTNLRHYQVDTHANMETRLNVKIELLLALARTLVRFVEFPTLKEGKALKIIVNSYVRQGKKLIPEQLASDTGYSKNLFHLYNMIIEIKELLMQSITASEDVECLIDGQPYEHEGYVMTNKYGTYKLIKRQRFSYANFNMKKTWGVPVD